jgi:hypothetical protein
VQEAIEGGVEATIEAIKQGVFAGRKVCIAGNGLEAGGAQGCIDALEQLQEDEADGISPGA